MNNTLPDTYEAYLEELATEHKHNEAARLLRLEQAEAEAKIFTYDEDDTNWCTREEAYQDFLEAQNYVDPDNTPPKVFNNYHTAIHFMNYYVAEDAFKPVLSEGKHDIYTTENENSSIQYILKDNRTIQILNLCHEDILDMYISEKDYQDYLDWISQ